MIREEDAEFLKHYGVKGMKWGVRRSPRQRVSARAERKNQSRTPQQRAQLAAKKNRKAKRKKQRKQARRELYTDPTFVATAAASSAYSVTALLTDMDTNPARYKKAATFAGKASRASMKTVKKAAEGAKIMFEKDMIVYSPGTIPVGSFPNAGVVLKALGS